jgi:hypothetical protein
MQLNIYTFEEAFNTILNNMRLSNAIKDSNDQQTYRQIEDLSLEETHDFFAELGYCYIEIERIQEKLWGPNFKI